MNNSSNDPTRLRAPANKPVGYQQGDEIGPYRIVGKIGQGGMGVIYEAFDARLDRHVALKFLPQSMNSDGAVRQRFLVEARAASQLDHPNICVIHDVGETPDGDLFITMPYYRGETLDHRISRGPIPLDSAIDIALQVGAGLATAHARDIVHRDIKPPNIMLTEDGGVRVLDFGIAKMANVHLTSTGMSMGTLAYMSPEQLYAKDIDARTDIWALGVVLYEMLVGRKAFPAKELPDILKAVLHGGNEIFHSLPVAMPTQIQEVLQIAMARDVDERYKDMVSMLQALDEAYSQLDSRDPAKRTKYRGPSEKERVRSYDWDERVLEIAANILTPHLGPIAPTLVKRMSRTASDIPELRNRLADYLPNKESRDDFCKQMKAQVAAFTSPPAPRALKTDGSLEGVGLSAVQLADLEAALTPFLGPIAQTIIKRQAAHASSMEQLCATLADYLNSEHDKQSFLKSVNNVAES